MRARGGRGDAETRGGGGQARRRAGVFLRGASAAVAAVALCAPVLHGQAPLPQGRAPIVAPRFEDLRGRVIEYLAARELSPEVRAEAEALWAIAGEESEATDAEASTAAGPDTSPEANFDRLMATFALVEPEVAELVAACDPAAETLVPPGCPLLEDKGRPALVRTNVALFYARYLVRLEMYDEALGALAVAELGEAADPAQILFYQAVCQHRLLLLEEGLETLAVLLDRMPSLAARHETVAVLMRHDLEAIQEGSLMQVSRMMEDIRRRLDLARPGERTQEIEEEVVAMLDRMIEELERQQGGGGGGGMGPGGIRSSGPASQSGVLGGTGPGEVDERYLRHLGVWGNLPDRMRARIMQQVARDFPPHYRDTVEEYFRRLAANPGPGGEMPEGE